MKHSKRSIIWLLRMAENDQLPTSPEQRRGQDNGEERTTSHRNDLAERRLAVSCFHHVSLIPKSRIGNSSIEGVAAPRDANSDPDPNQPPTPA